MYLLLKAAYVSADYRVLRELALIIYFLSPTRFGNGSSGRGRYQVCLLEALWF